MPAPSLIPNIFRYQKFSETQKGSTMFFATVRQQIFYRSRDIPLLGLKFSDSRNFLKHRRFPLRNFSALWYKIFSTENRDTFLH